MKTIGIIGAMSEEITYLKEKIEIVTTKNIIGLDFHVGKYCGNSIVLVISGIGKVNAAVCTQVLIDHFGVDYIINTGCAGAIHPELGIGDILISTDAVQHDMDVSALGDPIGTIPRLAESYFKADEMLVKLAQEAAAETAENYHVILGRVASGDKFIGTKEGKEHIKRYVQGDCAEMEGAAIAHACWLNRIPFVIIRAISDSADEQANMSYEQFVLLAAKRSSELVPTAFSSQQLPKHEYLRVSYLLNQPPRHQTLYLPKNTGNQYLRQKPNNPIRQPAEYYVHHDLSKIQL